MRRAIARSIVISRGHSLTSFVSGRTYLLSPMTSSLILTKGTGTPTFTRATTAYTVDDKGLKQAMPSGAARFPGLRVERNLFAALTDTLATQGVATIAGQYRVSFNGSGTITFSGSATGSLVGDDAATRKSILLTTTAGTLTCTVSGSVVNAMMSDVTYRTNQNPVDYVSKGTLSAPYHGLGTDGIKAFDYENPFTVGGNGVVTEGPHVPITGTKGMMFEPTSTNKCTCYGVPRADSYSSTLVSGNATKGKVYEIVARVSTDWGAVGTLLSGTANTAGAKYLITGILTFTATETGKEALDYPGTKAYHDGTTFQNPVTGMTLSGDTAAVLSIVTDQTAIDAAIAAEIAKGQAADEALLCALQLSRDNGYKSYDITTGAGGAGVVTFAGAMTAVATSMSDVIRVISGSCVISDSAGANTVTPSGSAYVRSKKENFTATATRTMIITVAASSQVRLLVPTLEELPFATSLNPSAGAASTHNADILSHPVAGNLPNTGRRHIKFSWTPGAVIAGRDEKFFYCGLDASNYIKIASNGVIIYFQKRVAGVDEFVCYTITPVAGTTYAIDAWFNADHTMGLKVNGVSAGSGLGSEKVPNPTLLRVADWTINNADGTHTVTDVVDGIRYQSDTMTPILSISKPAFFTQYKVYLWVISLTITSGLLQSDNLGAFTNGTKAAIAPYLYLNIYRNGANVDATIKQLSIKEVFNSSTTLTPVIGTNLFIGSDGTTAINGQIMDFEIRS